MNVKINDSWAERLGNEFAQPYFSQLTDFVRHEYATTTCYPPGRLIFNAFNLCPFDSVKVVIIGQDPYHEAGQAMGLSFSVPDGVAMPPSLQNIFKEIQGDLGIGVPQSGNLTRWAEQGVLLLNATLTVRAHQAGSHQRHGWERFTDAAISRLSEECPVPKSSSAIRNPMARSLRSVRAAVSALSTAVSVTSIIRTERSTPVRSRTAATSSAKSGSAS